MLADLLYLALHESIDPLGDTAHTLNSLAKGNHGLWKSDKQARFLLNRLKMPLFRDRAADAWAHRKGFDGHAFAVMQMIKGYGTRNISKARYFAQVFVVDNGGLIARGKVKVIHPKGGSGSATLDWNNVDVTFKRTSKPTITVDLDREVAARVKENQPHIDMIKRIPGWESKDILVSFVQQLEAGRALTAAQLGVIQRMVPETDVLTGSKDQWRQDFETYKKVAARILGIQRDDYVEKMTEYKKRWDQKVAVFREKHGREPTNMDTIMFGAKPTPPEEIQQNFDDAIRAMKSSGHIEDRSLLWIDSKMLWALGELTGRRVWPAEAMGHSDEVIGQHQKALKSKKPTKKSLRIIQWVARVANKASDAGAIARAALA